MMSCSLFHCFDPYVSWGWGKWLSFGDILSKWIFLFLVFFFLFNWQVYLVSAGSEMLLKKLVVTVWISFYSLIKKLGESFIILFSLFFTISLVNISGLVPFVFTSSSHLCFNLSFSLSLWLGGVLLALNKSLVGFLSHLVPTGTPLMLWAFLVLVESVSLFIRPLTLSIRLMANVMAGHLIVNLLGMFISGSSSFYLSVVLGGLLSFEMWVSMIQAYVFVSLLSLYWDES